MSWGNILLLFGGFVGILIALATVGKSKDNPANFFLIAFLFVCAIGILLKFLDHTDRIAAYPHLSRLNHPLGLLRPPLFFLFVYHTVTANRIRFASFLHLLPAVIMVAFLMPYLALDAETKRQIITGQLPFQSAVVPRWYGWVGLLYSTLYLVLSYLQYRKPDARVGAEVKRWLRLLLIGYAVFLITAVLTVVFDPTRTTSYVVFQVLSILIIAACVRMLQFPSGKRVQPKYAKSSLSEGDKEKYLLMIRAAMTEEELFVNEGFRMQDLAKRVQLSEHMVSQVINEMLGLSFTDFVNQLRVDKAKQLLVDPGFQHLTLEAIGTEAGFNSKAAFYTAFRRFAGTTPGDFQKGSVGFESAAR